jgi:two-component system cell cycle sensor histidine kinase/response regulator CckA
MNHFKKAVVLIAGGATDDLRTMQPVLTRAGFSVFYAQGVTEALEILRSTKPDLVICSAPTDERGADLLHAIRVREHSRTAQVLLIGEQTYECNLISKGVSDSDSEFLGAPCDPMLLVATVSRLIERGTGEQRIFDLGRVDRSPDRKTNPSKFENSPHRRKDQSLEPINVLYPSEEIDCEIVETANEEVWYRSLVENAIDIIYTHDLAGNYTSVNKAVERITGYSPDEALRMNFANIIVPEYRAKAHEMITRKLKGDPETFYELEIIAKNGRRVALEVNTRVLVQNGVPSGIQGIARDVTQRKQLELQLRQSQKMEAIGRLAGGVAHDFNNMLTAIAGYSDLTLQKLGSDDPLRRNIEEIKRAAERSAGLTKQLLAFSRKQVLQLKIFDINIAVKGMGEMVRRLIGEHIELRTDLELDLQPTLVDPGQIEQVIMNIVVNARDAMPKGGKLTIETANVYLDQDFADRHAPTPPGQYVMLSISDTGCGMDQETRGQVFEPFFTTKDVHKGTGLGLATVYGIVKQSDGYIWVYSEAGVGTTFKIYLPPVAEHALSTVAKTTKSEIKRGNETILLVEDEEMIRNLTRQILESQGYTVLTAVNGSEGLRAYERHSEMIELLLTDVVMPGMSGPEMAKRIEWIRPGTKVVYMSGYADDTMLSHGILSEDTDFLQKPFTPLSLCAKIREVLDR